jgi:large subunit ribosomal protein L22
MDIIATARYVRQSPRKVRLVASAVSSLSPIEAVRVLELMPQRAAKVVGDVIQSAMANANHNFQLQSDALHIRTLEIGEGPTLKRMRAASRGRGMSVMKRTSHVRVVLTDEQVAKKKMAKVQPKASVAVTKASKKSRQPKVVSRQGN